MPRDVITGVYSKPATATATAGTKILAARHNTLVNDLEATLNEVLYRDGKQAMTGALELSGDVTDPLDAPPFRQVQSTVGFATRAAAGAATIPAPQVKIYVRGHTTDGVGGAWYKEVTDTGTLEAWQFRSNGNTRRWQIDEHIVSPRMLGAVGDSSTIDTTKIRDTLAFMARVRSDSYTDAVIEFDGEGKTYAIDDNIAITSHPFTRFDKAKLKAVGTWSADEYMVTISGSTGHSNVGIEFYLGLECEKKANGLDVSSAPRSIIDPTINKFKDVGMKVGQYCWVARILGTLHEYEDTDADFTNPATRTATGVHLTSATGDIVVNTMVGWTYRCVLNESGGPVSIGGHWYTSCVPTALDPSPAPIDGIVYEHNTNAVTTLGCDSTCYLDTGRVVYRKGFLHIGPAAFFFNNDAVTHASKTAYIDMVASSAGQYHSIRFDGVYRSNRTMPLMKKVESGGNTWANISAELLLGNRDPFLRVDPFVFAVDSLDSTIARFVSPFNSGCYLAMGDSATTYTPQIGAKGNAFEIYTSGAKKLTVGDTGAPITAAAPMLLGPFTVATAPSPAAYTNCIALFTNGNSGSLCLAISSGSQWFRITSGAAISAS